MLIARRATGAAWQSAHLICEKPRIHSLRHHQQLHIRPNKFAPCATPDRSDSTSSPSAPDPASGPANSQLGGQTPQPDGTPTSTPPSTSTGGVIEADEVMEDEGTEGEEDGNEEFISEREYEEPLPPLPMELHEQACKLYVVLAAAYAIAAIGCIGSVLYNPLLLLPEDAGYMGCMLLGCCGAVALHATGLLLHMQGSVLEGELVTWRHQRMNSAVALFAVISLASQIWALPGSTPLLSGVVVVLSSATLLGCCWLGRAVWCASEEGWVQWAITPWDLQASWWRLRNYLYRDFSTIAGVACLLLLALSASAVVGVVLDPNSWAIPPWLTMASTSPKVASFLDTAESFPVSAADRVQEAVAGIAAALPKPGTQALHTAHIASTGAGVGAINIAVLSGHGLVVETSTVAGLGEYRGSVYEPLSLATAAALDGLRRFCGAGFVLTSVTAHALLERATYCRRVDVVTTMKGLLVTQLAGADREFNMQRPKPDRFNILSWVSGLLSPALHAGLLLALAPTHGVDLSGDGALFGPLIWTSMVSLVYALVLLVRLDWARVVGVLMSAWLALLTLLASFFQTFFIKMEWAEE
ncbi:hypothetical protein V8C86DRAFT_2675953 [Haematococcus lacustris]